MPLNATLGTMKTYTQQLVAEYEGNRDEGSFPDGASSAEIVAEIRAGGHTADQHEILEDLFFRVRAWERAGAILNAQPADYYNAAVKDAKRLRSFYGKVVNEAQRARLVS